MSSIDERVEKIEKFNSRISTLAWVVGIVGLSFGGIMAYSFKSIDKLGKGIEKEIVRSEILNDKLTNIDSAVDSAIRSKINGDLFISSYSGDSVLAQIQAQSACVAMEYARAKIEAKPPGFVAAVLREPTGMSAPTDKYPNGYPISRDCVSLCGIFVGIPYGKKLRNIGGLHIYDSEYPFDTSDEGNFFKGLGTYVYTIDTNEGFGPKYCCCSDVD